MSVERGWGRNVSSTVQRRGDKSTVQLSSAHTTSSLDTQVAPKVQSERNASREATYVSKPEPSTTPKKPDPWTAQVQSAALAGAFKRRVEERVAVMKANPELLKTFHKKMSSRVVWMVMAFFVITAIPFLLPLIFSGAAFYIVMWIFLPGIRAKGNELFVKIVEDIVVSSKVKGRPSKWNE